MLNGQLGVGQAARLALRHGLAQAQPWQRITEQDGHRRSHLWLTRSGRGIAGRLRLARHAVKGQQPRRGILAFKRFRALHLRIQRALAAVKVRQGHHSRRIGGSQLEKFTRALRIASHQTFARCSHRHAGHPSLQLGLHLRTLFRGVEFKNLPPGAPLMQLPKHPRLVERRPFAVAIRQRQDPGVRLRR